MASISASKQVEKNQIDHEIAALISLGRFDIAWCMIMPRRPVSEINKKLTSVTNVDT